MASYMEMFQDDPLAPLISAEAEAPLQQESKQSPITDVPENPSALQMAGDYATQRVVNKGVDSGVDAGFNKAAELFAASAAPTATTTNLAANVAPVTAFTQPAVAVGSGTTAGTLAGTTAGAAGATGLAAAAPWLIGGFMAGKALGFFNKGGAVHASAGMGIGPLAMKEMQKGKMGGLIGLAQQYLEKGDKVEPTQRQYTTLSGMPRNNEDKGFHEFMDDYGPMANLYRFLYGENYKVGDPIKRQSGGLVNAHIGGMVNMAGPLSGIRYKSQGGDVKEEVEIKYAPLGG